MIIGMTFIVMLLLPILHKAFLNLFLFCCKRDRKLKRVIEKNLVSHKTRNTKTSMMMSITISFLVFAGATFELMGSLLTSTIETAVGADIYAASTDKSLGSMINDGPITKFLQQQKDKEGDVLDWTYCSENLQRVLKVTSHHESYFSEESGYAIYETGVYSI